MTGPSEAAAAGTTAAARSGPGGPPVRRPAAPGARATAKSKLDGRSARAERTRQAIIDALLAFSAEGEIRASPERIVARAGVSLRTLWTNFKDLDGLYAAVNDRLIALQDAQARPIPPDAPRGRRVRAFCDQRARMLEIVAPSARAAQPRLPYSVQLRRNQELHYTRLRDDVEAVFARELGAAGDAREELTRAVVVTSAYPVWSVLRDDLGLGVDAAAGVLRVAVTALLDNARPARGRPRANRQGL